MSGRVQPLLAVRDLGVRFGGLAALRGVNLDVAPGEVVGILGPNGSGKTTLLNALGGLTPLAAGSVHLDGVELTGLPAWAIARLGLVRTFQEPGLFGRLDVVDNLLLGIHGRGRSGVLAGMWWFGRSRREDREQRRLVEAMVDALGLGSLRGKPVGSLPYGSQKVIELARATAREPRVLLLDEPAAGVDGVGSESMAASIRRASAAGAGVVVVEHDVAFVSALADRVVVLDVGEVLVEGTPAEVRVDERVVTAYLGPPALPGPAT